MLNKKLLARENTNSAACAREVKGRLHQNLAQSLRVGELLVVNEWHMREESESQQLKAKKTTGKSA